MDIDFTQEKMLACDIGILNPNNGKFGKAQFITNDHGKMTLDTYSIVRGSEKASSN